MGSGIALDVRSRRLPELRNRARVGGRRVNDLRSQINSLSPAEKAELLDTVWESLEADAC